MNMYVRPVKSIPINCAKDVIDTLFTFPDGTRSGYAQTTFADAELTQYECVGARRSFEDLLTITRTYYPETTEIELMGILRELNIGYWYCPDVRKIVFFTNGPCKVQINSFDSLTKNGYETIDWAKGTFTAKRLFEIRNQL